MGACGSKGITAHQNAGTQPRDLSRWKAADENASDAPATSAQQEDDPRSSGTPADHGEDLALSAVISISTQHCLAKNDNIADPGSQCLTAWEDGSIRQMNWQTGKVARMWKPHTRAVNRLVVGERSGAIYSCSRDTTIAVTSFSSSPALGSGADTSAAILRGHSLNVSTLAVDADETILCSGGRDTQTKVWDLATTALLASNTTALNVITCSKWVPRETVVAQGSEDLTVKFWDVRSSFREPVQVFRGYIYFPLGLDVADDGVHVVTSSKGFNGVGGEIRIWDRRMGRQVRQFAGHQQDATSCCFLPRSCVISHEDGDGITVEMASNECGMPTPVSASKDGTVKVWDVTTNGCNSSSGGGDGALLCEAHGPPSAVFTSLCVVPKWCGNEDSQRSENKRATATTTTTSSTVLLGSTFHGHLLSYTFDGADATLTARTR